MRGAEAKMPHALLIPLALQGHISPMMQLARKLVSNGFHVTFLNTDFNHQRIIQANSNKKFTRDGRDMIRMISVPDGLPPEDKHNNIPNLLQALQNSLGPPVIHKLIQEINDSEEEGKVTCIIADVWTCFGLNAVAQQFQIPLAAFHTSLVSTCAIRYFSSRLVSLGIVSQDGSPREDQKVKYLPSMPPLDSSDLPWRYGGEYIFRLGMRTGEEIKPIKWVLFNTISELEAPVVDELSKEVRVYPIGPLFSSEFQDGETTNKANPLPSLWADDVECLGWLDKQSSQSVIYVSFGSLAVWNERQVEEFALGLQATQRPFLWVVRSDLVGQSNAVFPPGFLEGTRDRGCIVSWAPQLRVLSHPSIACFLTHCGWNSVQESITMGVPMLCSPHFGDQFINRTYIVDVWKAGLPLNANKDGIIENGELTKAVKRLVMKEEGVQIRKEVSKLKSIARNAVKEGGSSSNNYALFVKEIRQLIG